MLVSATSFSFYVLNTGRERWRQSSKFADSLHTVAYSAKVPPEKNSKNFKFQRDPKTQSSIFINDGNSFVLNLFLKIFVCVECNSNLIAFFHFSKPESIKLSSLLEFQWRIEHKKEYVVCERKRGSKAEKM